LPAVLRLVGAIVFLVLVYTVLMLAVAHLPPNYAAGGAFLVPLIGFAAVAGAVVPERRRE